MGSKSILGIAVGPLEGLSRFVVMTNVFHDLSAQVGLGFENAPGDDIALDLGEPDLHLIEP